MSLEIHFMGGDTKGFRKLLGYKVIGILFTTGVLTSLALATEEKANQVKEEAEERILIVGVPAEYQAAMVEFLVNDKIEYRFDSKTRTFFVKNNPVEVLEKARLEKTLNMIAQRGLWEREIEIKFREKWPEVEDPRICISLPSYQKKTGKDEGEAIAFVLAKGITEEEVEKVKELVKSKVPGLPDKNITIVGTNWRPGPSYEKGGKRVASIR